MSGFGGSGTDLSFDLEDLQEGATSYQSISDDLSQMKQQLCTLLDDLSQKGWTTEAGIAFSQMVAMDWGDTIDRYCDMLETLSEILTRAAKEYDGLVREQIETIHVLS